MNPETSPQNVETLVAIMEAVDYHEALVSVIQAAFFGDLLKDEKSNDNR